MNRTRLLIGLAALAPLIDTSAARAQDRLKIAIGQRGVYENSVSELGQNAGLFKKHGLALDILYTQGGGETQQAVISGSVDLGIGVGTHGVLGAFAKGAPVRVLGSTMTGAHDLFWYVPASSPIKNMKEAQGRSIAYSTNGSSTNMVVLAMQKHFGITFKPVATGSPASTYTQAMSGQVDIGWSAPPLGVEAMQENKIRLIARGSDVPNFRDQTVRVIVANAGELAKRRHVFARYMQAYRETLDWMYSDPASIKAYAAWAGVSEVTALRIREEFQPKENLNPDRVLGLEAAVVDAVTFKYLRGPLSQKQLAELVQILPPVR
jgi:NitT/TauT family transport system substrate-binding protein